jgi:chitodextrinase
MNISKTLILAIGIIVITGALLIGCRNSGLQSGTVATQPTIRATTLSGTAAAGAPIATAQITLKDRYGMLKTIETGTDGKYSVDVSGMTAPFLLRITSGGTTTLYSTASDTGTVNIHPFTDLIIRSWYKAKGSDIDTDFVGTEPLASPPTASEIATIEAVIRSILSTWLTQVGLTENSFNLFTSPFDANSEGFDKVLDYTKVTIDATGQVALTSTDPETGIGGTTISTFITNLTATDASAPTNPSGLSAMASNAGQVVLLWNASTDNVGAAGYAVYRDGSKIGISPFPVYMDTELAVGTKYCYKVEAFDGAGNISNSKSAEACVTALAAADTVAPSVPSGLTATAGPSGNISLSWNASTDNTAVLAYKVFRGTTEIATIAAPANSQNDTGLTAGTMYCYTVKAFDTAMNLSSESVPACATTLALTMPETMVWKSSFAGTVFSKAPTKDNTYFAMVLTQSGFDLSGIIGFQDTLGQSGTTAVTGSISDNSIITAQYADFDPACASRIITLTGTVGSSSMILQASAPSGGSCVKGDHEMTFALATPITYAASGTYLVSSSTLTLNTTSTTFKAGRGLNIGPTLKTGITVSATTLTWDNANSAITWRRANGAANDITGTWTAVNPSGNSLEFTFNADGTFSHIGNIITNSTGNPVVSSVYRTTGYSAHPRYDDPAQSATSVVVTGPGIANSLSLLYNASCGGSGGCWDTQWLSPVKLGTTHPTPPITYTFTTQDASTTKTATATVGCFMESLPSNLVVSKNPTSGNLTFTWTKAYSTNPNPNLKYHVQISDSAFNNVWNSPSVIDADTITYTSPALTTGALYNITLTVDAFELDCASSITTPINY